MSFGKGDLLDPAVLLQCFVMFSGGGGSYLLFQENKRSFKGPFIMSYRVFVVALLIHFARVSEKSTASHASLKYDNQFPGGNKTKEHSMIIVMNRYPGSGDICDT